MSLTPDEEWRWHSFVAGWAREFLEDTDMIADRILKPNAWPKFRLFRFRR